MGRVYPFEPSKIDQTFGNPTSYGPHEGLDLNGLNGGNTDCNTPLYIPLTVDGAKLIFTSYSTSGYGRMAIFEVKTPRGPRYHRYAHLNEVLVSVGQAIGTSQPVAKMGSTGNSVYCHLHWDIFEKLPPNSNWRWYPKTVAELYEYMIDPQEWINVYKDYKPSISTMPDELKYTEAQFTEVREARDSNWNLYQSLKTEYDSFKKTMDDRRDRLAVNLASASDWDEIVNGSARFRDLDAKNLDLQDKLDREMQAHKQTVLNYEEKLRSLRNEMDDMRSEYEGKITNMQAKVDAEIEALQKAKQQYEVTSRIAKWFSSLWRKK